MSTVESRQVPLLDLKAQFRTIRAEIETAIQKVLETQHFIMGPEVQALEGEVAAYCKVRHAIGCASGSDALFLALLALDVAHNDKVLTTPYTFFATVGAIVRAGATPVFADIDPASFNLSPESVAQALDKNPDIKVIIPVHLYGACADMRPILEMAKQRGIAVIEDAAQAIGSEYHGTPAGSMGDIGCFSFFPSKNLGAFGDGGILTTNNDDLAAKLRALRVHGAKRKYYHDYVGVNSRLDALQAAILRVKLRHLDDWTAGRQRNADFYRKRIAELGIPIELPVLQACNTRHIYNQFVICSERRDELKAFLYAHGIGTEIYYPVPMHLQNCFAELGYKERDFPVSERKAATSLALPVYPELSTGDLEYVCQMLRQFYS